MMWNCVTMEWATTIHNEWWYGIVSLWNATLQFTMNDGVELCHYGMWHYNLQWMMAWNCVTVECDTTIYNEWWHGIVSLWNVTLLFTMNDGMELCHCGMWHYYLQWMMAWNCVTVECDTTIYNEWWHEIVSLWNVTLLFTMNDGMELCHCGMWHYNLQLMIVWNCATVEYSVMVDIIRLCMWYRMQ